MDSPTAQALASARAALTEVRAASDHLTAEMAALIRRIEDLEARLSALEDTSAEQPKKPVKAAK